GLNHPVRILDAWSVTNPDSTIPALSLINPNDELRPSTYFLESGSYLKLRQIEFGYSLPQKVLSDLGVARIRLALSAQNLLGFHKENGPDAFTGIDPESPAANAYIRPQIFLFTLDVSL